MLTPVEIQSKSFKSGGLGYDKKDVDNFMREVLRSYEDVYRENVELKDKVAVLNEGIQYYKSIEKTLQKALILAEKTAEDTRNAAAKDAKRIEKEATTKANILLADAKNELDALHKQTVALIQQYEKYKLQFKNLAQTQIELLDTEAFSLNIQKLDVFASDPEALSEISNHQKTNRISRVAPVPSPKDIPAPEENTDDAQNIAVNKGGHLSDLIEDSEEFAFGDYMVGQEEFDFVDLNDNE